LIYTVDAAVWKELQAGRRNQENQQEIRAVTY
jgi:hypothetical protein